MRAEGTVEIVVSLRLVTYTEEIYIDKRKLLWLETFRRLIVATKTMRIGSDRRNLSLSSSRSCFTGLRGTATSVVRLLKYPRRE